MIYRSVKLGFNSLFDDKSWLVALTIAFVFILFSANFVIGHYQSYGGDFGQYFIHAQNLLKGREWSYSVEGYPAVLPLYPCLLAILTYFFGVNAFYYALVNTVMWAATCVIWCSIYTKKFAFKSVIPVYMLFIVFLPFVVGFQQEAIPNIMFAMCCALSVKAILVCEEKGISTFWVTLVLLPALVRVESIAFFCAYIVYFLINRKFLVGSIGVVGIALTVIADCYIGLNLGMKSNFIVLQDFNNANVKGADSRLVDTLIAIVHLASSYLLGLGEMFIPGKLKQLSQLTIEFSPARILVTSYISILVLFIFLIGFLRKSNFFKLDFLIFFALLGLVSLFPLPEAPIRYVLPIFPIFAFYIIDLLVRMIRAGVKNEMVAGFGVFLILAPLFYFSLIVAINEPQRRNFLFNKYTTEMADWVAENRNQRKIAFFKTRLMIVLMDIRDKNDAEYGGLRNVRSVDRSIDSGELLVVFKTTGFSQAEILAHLEENGRAEKLWENKLYAVFGRR